MPDTRIFALALPSAIALVLLVAHSLRALPRARAIAFWVAVIAYGIARGIGVELATRRIGASFPYEIHRPLLKILGVSAQEIAGWAVVGYLAWWLGWRFSRQLFVQTAWGALFLGCVSWAVEAAAVAAGWWHWNVPTASRFFMNVPPIGLVDWFFVGTDFVLPFAAISAAPRDKRRWALLLLFPIHFASHAVPPPAMHVVHWSLLALLVALAMGSKAEDDSFASRANALPLIAAGIIVADAAVVLLFLVGRPRLALAVIPLVLHVAISTRGPFAFRRSRRAAAVAVLTIFAVGTFLHARSIEAREELQRRLDGAIAARDRGELAYATAELEALTREFPNTHVPRALLGEIYYRTGRASEAMPLFERSVEIKQDYLDGYRYAAVIALQNGERERAVTIAKRGLDVAPKDAQLRYLATGRIERPATAEEAATLAALAFEVGDAAASARVLEEAVARWPENRVLKLQRERLSH